MRVALTAGYARSKHAIALMGMLKRIPSVEVVLLLQVKTFTIKRLTQLVKLYGVSNAIQKFKNIFVPSPDHELADETRYIAQFLEDNDIGFSSVNEACARLGVRCTRVESLNSDAAVAAITENDVDLLVYAGGGILRKNCIAATRYGVLNAHSGPLPFFRGMNCLEWTLLHGVKPQVTVHLIDTGVDTGPILNYYPWELDANDTIYSLRGKSVVMEVKALTDVVSRFDHFFAGKRIQRREEGKQFFMMHPFLKKNLSEKLSRNATSLIPYEEFEKRHFVKA